MVRPSTTRRSAALLMTMSLAGAALGGLQCGGTEDLSPRVDPRPYEVLGDEECAAFPTLLRVFRKVSLGPGSHTLRLEASTYSDQPDSSYRSRFICVLLGAGAGNSEQQDWFFTLNGEGDERTVTYVSNGSAYIGYIGTVPLGGHGSSVIALDGQQFSVPAEDHSVVAEDLPQRFIEISYEHSGAGNYQITLDKSDFSPRSGLVAPLVVLYFEDPAESTRDHLITTLNGIDDKVTVYLEADGRIFAGFVDELAVDNSGGADLTVTFQGAP